MLLTITTRHTPATDLGYLLHKHPAKVQEVTFVKGRCGKCISVYSDCWRSKVSRLIQDYKVSG